MNGRECIICEWGEYGMERRGGEERNGVGA